MNRFYYADIDECAYGNGGCSPHSTCKNTPPGSYSCVCDKGYIAEGSQCVGQLLCFYFLLVFSLSCSSRF